MQFWGGSKDKIQKEALEKAIEKYNYGDYDEGNFAEDWNNQELDIEENNGDADNLTASLLKKLKEQNSSLRNKTYNP